MGALSIKIICILLLISATLVSGILIFLKGFLLTRTVVNNSSECKPEFSLHPHDGSGHDHQGIKGCWMHGRYKRAIIMIIDALRYDFLVSKSERTGETSNYHHDKLTNVQRLHENMPMNSRIYKFMADPPTTTMQRLKGLTTGGLPTFVDAGSNFQSYEITEDNIIHQLINSERERRITFLGDDTWLSLYPQKFNKSFGFPSFDVKDLHTVDNGILKHLCPEMKSPHWDVIIAHFLGVDHCGHRYGPNHQAMADKLSQMNEVIGNVTQLMAEDTVLFVMGDHGMTRTGDHGGDSFNELAAGLWIYSPGRLASSHQGSVEEISQTDFVPTLSLLLGVPIPFSNLGKVIPELFSHCSWWGTATNEVRKRYHKLKALWLNAHQVHDYLKAYQEVSSDLPQKNIVELTDRFDTAKIRWQELMTRILHDTDVSEKIIDDLADLEIVFNSYLTDARKVCQDVWAKFDLVMISLGLVTILVGIFLLLYFFLMPDEDIDGFPRTAVFVVGGAVLHLIYVSSHLLIFPKTVPPVMAFVIGGVFVYAVLIICKGKFIEYISQSSVDNLVAFVVTILNLLIYFSNSFVVHEDAISTFLLQSLIISIWFATTTSTTTHSKEKPVERIEIGRSTKKSKTQQNLLQMLVSPVSISLILTVTCMALVQLSSNFKACREEQVSCTDSFFLLPLSTIDRTSRNQRYILSISCLVILAYSVRRWLTYYGNLNGMSLSVVVLSYVPWMGVIFTSLHWALQALPPNLLDSIPQWQQAVMAQVVYVLVIAGLIVLLISPMLIYTQARQTSSVSLPYGGNPSQAIPSIYSQLKVQLSGSEEEKPPVVYGLGSVYSSSIAALLCLVSSYLCLLLNDGVSPSIVLALWSFYLALELYSALLASRRKQSKGEGPLDRFSWSGLVLQGLFTTVFFYHSGHQATIPSIRMEAAYTGFYGNFNSYLLPGFLIWSNTFASHILFGFASPLLIFWPALSSALLPWLVNSKEQRHGQSTWQGDFRLFNDGIRLRKRFLHLICGILLLSSLKVLSSACAATLHRRHLMVWKIFAPRFIYEAAMFVTTCVTLVLSLLFVLRVDSTLSKFVRTLPTESRKEN